VRLKFFKAPLAMYRKKKFFTQIFETKTGPLEKFRRAGLAYKKQPNTLYQKFAL